MPQAGPCSTSRAERAGLHSGEGMAVKKWQCILCNFVYDEAAGLPDEGIPPGTRWEDVPADWTCPYCGATKADFVMIAIA